MRQPFIQEVITRLNRRLVKILRLGLDAKILLGLFSVWEGWARGLGNLHSNFVLQDVLKMGEMVSEALEHQKKKLVLP